VHTNSFRGPFPPIATLTRLRFLYVSSPSRSSAHSFLRASDAFSSRRTVHRDLSQNCFSGAIPNSISALTKPQDVYVRTSSLCPRRPTRIWCIPLRLTRRAHRLRWCSSFHCTTHDRPGALRLQAALREPIRGSCSAVPPLHAHSNSRVCPALPVCMLACAARAEPALCVAAASFPRRAARWSGTAA
jgi:hypothetical protein